MAEDIWYLASPYSHEDRAVMGQRYRWACQATARLFTNNVFAYSPIAHTYAVDVIGELDASSFEKWEAFDLGMIDRLTGLLVLTIAGWDESRGVRAEMDHANATGKPIRFMVPRFFGPDLVDYEIDPHLANIHMRDTYLAGLHDGT